MQLGKMLSPAASIRPGQAPYLANRHVQWNRVVVHDLDTMSFTPSEREKYALKEGDLLVCEGGEVGRSALWMDVGYEVFFQKAIHRLRARVSDVSPSFVLRLMRRAASNGAFTDYTSQTSIAHLTQEKLGQVVFSIPPLSEQRAIAAVLDTIDDAIRKTEQIIAKLQQVKQGLLHDLLTRGIDDNGELRDPERHPEQFQDTPLGRIPKGWEVAPFASYGSPNRPYIKTGPFGSSLKQEHWVSEGTPVITIGSLGEGSFIASELLYIAESTARALNAYAVEPGDIVFSRVAEVGRSVVVGVAQTGWIMSSNLMWISVDPRRAVPEAVQAQIALNSAVRRQIGRLVNVGGREVANAAVMNALRLPWPSFNEQKQIAKALQANELQVNAELAALLKLRAIKSGLAEDLLTGRVRTTALSEITP